MSKGSEKRTVLVTGGAGYIGSHTCKALAAMGYNVVVFDNLINGHRDFVKWGPLEVGDLNDSAALDRVFEEHRPEAIVHFAALGYVGESVSEPLLYYRNNVGGTLSLVESAVKHGVDKLVFSSTCATYGIPEVVPITEEEGQAPINPYGETKLAIEKMLGYVSVAKGLKSVSLRYFNAAGADPGCEVGEDHDPETHLIPLVFDAASGRRESITIFGDDYDTPDGTCVRDYIHVNDLASAHILALKYLFGGGETTAFNLGTGSGYSVQEIIDVSERVLSTKVPRIIGQRRDGDPECLVSASNRIKDVLGWVPLRSDIESIIKDAWSWHRKRFSN